MDAVLRVHEGKLKGKVFRLKPGRVYLLGRISVADIRVPDSLVSRNHCRLECRSGKWVAIDLNSSNGTYVNDVKIEEHNLRTGDALRIGETVFRFEAEGEPAPAAATPAAKPEPPKPEAAKPDQKPAAKPPTPAEEAVVMAEPAEGEAEPPKAKESAPPAAPAAPTAKGTVQGDSPVELFSLLERAEKIEEESESSPDRGGGGGGGGGLFELLKKAEEPAKAQPPEQEADKPKGNGGGILSLFRKKRQEEGKQGS